MINSLLHHIPFNANRVKIRVLQLLKIIKVNIGTEEKPKFAHVGDCWDEETMTKTTYLLHEFQDLFPTKFSEIKGILGDLGEMKIPLKPDVKPVQQRPCRLNL